MVRVNASVTLMSRFSAFLVLTAFSAFVLTDTSVYAQQGLANRTLVPADSSQTGLISDVVDDRAIKQLISSKSI